MSPTCRLLAVRIDETNQILLQLDLRVCATEKVSIQAHLLLTCVAWWTRDGMPVNGEEWRN